MSAWIEGPFRYSLSRPTGEMSADGTVGFVMLNPSTADAAHDDPTVRRIVGFARRWGFAKVEVVNLFAFRATDPKNLWLNLRAGVDVVGPRNDEAIESAACGADEVVVAWGKGSWLAASRVAAVVDLLRRCRGTDIRCLALNGDGSPKHPLYVAADVKLSTWGRA